MSVALAHQSVNVVLSEPCLRSIQPRPSFVFSSRCTFNRRKTFRLERCDAGRWNTAIAVTPEALDVDHPTSATLFEQLEEWHRTYRSCIVPGNVMSLVIMVTDNGQFVLCGEVSWPTTPFRCKGRRHYRSGPGNCAAPIVTGTCLSRFNIKWRSLGSSGKLMLWSTSGTPTFTRPGGTRSD